jgi:acetyltransferase-like isoleucine patch superfamily enzyme
MTAEARLVRGAAWLAESAHYLVVDIEEWALSTMVYSPALRAACKHTGARLSLTSPPRVRGKAKIAIGSDCRFSTFDVEALAAADTPEIHFGDGCFVANDTLFTVGRGIWIGDHVGIGAWVDIRDVDGPGIARRRRGERFDESDASPVTIEDHAWIGRGAHIAKGVRIGQHAIVAAGSIVIDDVPDGALAMGAPARILRIQ